MYQGMYSTAKLNRLQKNFAKISRFSVTRKLLIGCEYSKSEDALVKRMPRSSYFRAKS